MKTICMEYLKYTRFWCKRRRGVFYSISWSHFSDIQGACCAHRTFRPTLKKTVQKLLPYFLIQFPHIYVLWPLALCTVIFGFPNSKMNSFRRNYMRKYDAYFFQFYFTRLLVTLKPLISVEVWISLDFFLSIEVKKRYFQF